MVRFGLLQPSQPNPFLQSALFDPGPYEPSTFAQSRCSAKKAGDWLVSVFTQRQAHSAKGALGRAWSRWTHRPGSSQRSGCGPDYAELTAWAPSSATPGMVSHPNLSLKRSSLQVSLASRTQSTFNQMAQSRVGSSCDPKRAYRVSLTGPCGASPCGHWVPGGNNERARCRRLAEKF